MIVRKQRLGLALLLPALCLATTAVAMKPGGWSKVAVTDKGVVAATAFAVQAKRAAMRANGDEATLELEAIEAAEQQVVAGLNYRLELEVSAGGRQRRAVAVVWAREWLEAAQRYELTSWEFDDSPPKLEPTSP